MRYRDRVEKNNMEYKIHKIPHVLQHTIIQLISVASLLASTCPSVLVYSVQ